MADDGRWPIYGWFMMIEMIWQYFCDDPNWLFNQDHRHNLQRKAWSCFLHAIPCVDGLFGMKDIAWIMFYCRREAKNKHEHFAAAAIQGLSHEEIWCLLVSGPHPCWQTLGTTCERPLLPFKGGEAEEGLPSRAASHQSARERGLDSGGNEYESG